MKPTVMDLFSQAATRGKDLAALIEAAKTLTMMARNRISDAAREPGLLTDQQVSRWHRTAGYLGNHVRQEAEEARQMLASAQEIMRTDPLKHELPTDFEELCDILDHTLSQAMTAVERLEAIRLNSVCAHVDLLAEQPCSPEARRCADSLFARLLSNNRLRRNL